MKTIAACAALSIAFGILTGPSPTEDQRCYNPAYGQFGHYQAGVWIDHSHSCATAVPPPNYGQD